ncbi:MAG: hypothetical protein K6G28_06270, partial [Acholeplasmatales bacterium]|nr:hypothetical protein [Acholeplasmatales bacterium]
MAKIFSSYFSLGFKRKTILINIFTSGWMLVFGLTKIAFSYAYGKFFLACGIASIILGLAKILTLHSIRKKAKTKSIYNIIIALMVIAAGITMALIMYFLNIAEDKIKDYPIGLSIIVAISSTLELLITIIGLYKVAFKGHFFRNLKMINLCQAFTSLALTNRFFLISSREDYLLRISSIFGIVVGIFITMIGVIIFASTYTSIYDKLNHEYVKTKDFVILDHYSIQLHNSFFFGDFTYEAYKVDDNTIDGNIIKHKPRVYESSLIYKVLYLLISPILLIPYIGILIFELNHSNYMVKQLNKIMESKG